MVDLIQKIIETIEPSIGGYYHMKYYPASTILKDKKTIDCVYFVNVKKYFKNWGNDPSRAFVNIEDVVDIKESPYRLPVEFANKIYERGETGMGWIGFIIEMKDYKGFSYLGGNAIDFIDLPEGYEMKDILSVEGMHDYALLDKKERKVKDYSWCLVDDDRLL